MRAPWILQAVAAFAPTALLHVASPLEVEFRTSDVPWHGPDHGFVLTRSSLAPGSADMLHFGIRGERGWGCVDGATLITSKGLHPPAHPETTAGTMQDPDSVETRRTGGTQAVMRAVDILEAVADGPVLLPDLVVRLGISKPTCHRIASALVERGLLTNSGRTGYRLGPLFKELGSGAAG